MINAGRILIVPKGDWNNLDPYEMLDLVTYSKTAYIARKASVGVNPQTDVQQEYWQPFGTAVEIATTDKPGIVMPDGTTITISQTGLIEAHLSLDDLSNVDIVNPTNGQVLAFSSILNGWQSQSLGTAALKDSSNVVTEDSTDLVESGAVYDEIDTLKQTLETSIDGKQSKILTIAQTIGGTSRTTVEAALGALADSEYLVDNLTSSSAVKALTANQGLQLANKHKVTRKTVDTSSWTADTSSQSGSTLYKKSISLSHVYVDSPSVDISTSSGTGLPTTAQQKAYDLLQYVTVDGTTMYLYSSAIPTTTYYIEIEGVD